VKTAKYVIAAVAFLVWLILAWFLGSWLHLQGSSLWVLRIALAVIGAIALAALIWWFILKDRESAQESAQEAGAGGDEIEVLIREAEKRLQSSQLGKAARIGTLPVILLLGESGSAKTSVVLRSGLEPELLAGQAVQDNAPVPTRVANLWYTRQFIFAEAGGSLTADAGSWINLVKRLAPRRLHSIFGKGTPSPRAALVCVDCESFMQQGAAEALGGSVERLRTRLREVSQLLGIALPVYVLFSRADRLPYFQEYVSNLSDDEAGVVLGTTLPMASYSTGVYAEQETVRVSSAFDNLFYSLAARRRPLLSREFDAEKLPLVYEFPREFRKLQSLLVRLLVDICRPSQLRMGPFLRGFYFTGVRPVVINTSRSAPAASEALTQPSEAPRELGATGVFNIRKLVAQAAAQSQPVESTESRRVPQWTFLPHVFTDVLLKDSSALAASTSSTKTSLWRRLLLVTSIVVLVIFIAGFIVSFVRNKNLESQVKAAAQGASSIELTGQQLPSVDALSRLDTLRQAVQTLADYRENGPPLSMRWGLYEGNSLYPYARRLYFAHFRELLFGSTQGNLVQTLKALPVSPAPTDDFQSVYDTLKAYLITTSNHDKSSVEFLSPVLQKAWAARREIDKVTMDLAAKQFDFYSEQLQGQNPFSSDNDANVVEHSRHYLTQMVGADQVYNLLKSQVNKTTRPVNFNKDFPGSADTVVDGTTVEGAFTKPGWTAMHNILGDLPKYFSGEEWVLGAGSSSSMDLAKLARILESRYQLDYIAQWRAFVKGARVVGYTGAADASQKLLKLTSNDTPLLALFCTAAQNVAVDQPDIKKAFQPVLTVESPACQEQHQYIGDANKPYIGGLSALQTCIDGVSSAPGQQPDLKTACGDPATKAHAAAQQIGQGFTIDQDAHVDQTVQNLLYEPITAANSVQPPPVGPKGLCTPFGPLASTFPFSTIAKTDATLQDVDGFFNPASGALSKFYTANLKNSVTLQGTTYIGNPDASPKVPPALLRFFNQAMALQRALYSGAPGQLQYKYALRPHPTPSVIGLTMTIDGQPLSFMGGNASFQTFTWPGTGGSGVKLTVKMSGGSDFGWPSYDGTWGVFHFFADADEFRQNGNIYTVISIPKAGGRPMTTPDGKPVTVQFDLDTLGQSPLLQKGFLSTMHCPG
jgi:type VI secretion system protein ImpL